MLAFKLTSVKKTKQRHFRLICDTVLQLLAHFVLWDTEILFPQHVAAADKSSVTGASLNLSPLIVPSILVLYVNIGELAT